jgi:sec-independent protein translocase protein TatA
MNLGWQEISVVVLVVLLLFGAKKLPELGRLLGQGIKEFKKGAKGDSGGDGKPSDDRGSDE